jgi:hypothetical protein
MLKTAPGCLPYAEYVDGFDRDLVDLGAGIIERWGRGKKKGNSVGAVAMGEYGTGRSGGRKV